MWKVYEFCALSVFSTLEIPFVFVQIHESTCFFSFYHGVWPLRGLSNASLVADMTARLRAVRAAYWQT